MILTPEDVSKVRFGSELTVQSIDTLRILRDAFGVIFKIKEDIEIEPHTMKTSESDQLKARKTLLISCLGTGYLNANRTAT